MTLYRFTHCTIIRAGWSLRQRDGGTLETALFLPSSFLLPVFRALLSGLKCFIILNLNCKI